MFASSDPPLICFSFHVAWAKVFIPTIEDIYEASVDTDRGTKEVVRFYDVGGLAAKNRELPRHYLATADAFVLVFSATSLDSFGIVESIKKDVERNREKRDAVVMVLSNKSDVEDERQVDRSQASTWAAKERVRLFEVSAFDIRSLIEPFTHLSSRLNPPPAKSTFPQLSMVRKVKEAM